MSKKTDIELALLANEYISSQLFVSRKQIADYLGISRQKTDRIASEGLIINYPKAMSYSRAATLGRSKGNKWGGKFYLRGTPKFEGTIHG